MLPFNNNDKEIINDETQTILGVLCILDSLANGINPITGEIFDIGLCRNNIDILSSIKNLSKVIKGHKNSTKIKISYTDFENNYPNYVIIRKEGCFYTTHNNSADKMSELLDYKVYIDYFNRKSTGGPNLDYILQTLQDYKCPYILVEYGEIVEKYDGDLCNLTNKEQSNIMPTNKEQPNITPTNKEQPNITPTNKEQSNIMLKTDIEQKKEYTCNDCMDRKSGECCRLSNIICEDFRYSPSISKDEAKDWPQYGDATVIGLKISKNANKRY